MSPVGQMRLFFRCRQFCQHTEVLECCRVTSDLRAAGDFEQAESILNDLRKQVPHSHETALRNEEAALLWQRGKLEKAAEIWSQLPDSPAVLFNRGMAALFLGQSAVARECLKKAVAELPESGGWHHLGSLYLALAEMRS